MVPHFPLLHFGAAFSGLAFSVAPHGLRGEGLAWLVEL